MRLTHGLDRVVTRQLQREAFDCQRVLRKILRLREAGEPLVGQLADRVSRPGQRVYGRGTDHDHQCGEAGNHERELRGEGLWEREFHGRCQIRR
ncbi:hypothetical protein [Paraburkholderia fynbosensis]|uniref:hypothetical protein n=1 Tax=Paraburkholderia fynbosensis TaxID=1200993 RepID=UPI001FE39EB7|nr:hypothetical protein [Paraburkholderia fynbosensis]